MADFAKEYVASIDEIDFEANPIVNIIIDGNNWKKIILDYIKVKTNTWETRVELYFDPSYSGGTELDFISQDFQNTPNFKVLVQPTISNDGIFVNREDIHGTKRAVEVTEHNLTGDDGEFKKMLDKNDSLLLRFINRKVLEQTGLEIIFKISED